MTRGLRLSIALAVLLALAACEATPQPSAAGPSQPAPSTLAPSASPAAPSAVPAAFHWAKPTDGSTVKKRRLTLRATADSDASGDNATVIFSVDWPGSEPKQACETEARAGGAVWECEVDLAALKAPSGRLRVDFDVDRGSGDVEESPDGKRTLDYQPPAPKWRAARTILPKSCSIPALAIDEGRYHVATDCGDGIRYAGGAATGTWSEKTFRPPADHAEAGPQLAVDGNTLYLAYTRYGPVTDVETCGDGVLYKDLGVYYRTRTLPNGKWSAPKRIGKNNDVLDSFRVADGTIHAVVAPNRGSRAVYETVKGDSLVRVPLPGALGGTSLRVGSDGKPRVAYLNWHDRSIRLATVDGTTVATTTVASKGSLLNPLLVLGGGNQPHVVWTRDATAEGGCAVPGPAPADGTYYGTLVDGKWVTERITKDTGMTSLVVDPDTGIVHVLVGGNPNKQGGGRLRHYERSPGGKWTSTPLRPGPAEGGLIIRRDESDGTLVVLFKDTYTDSVQMITRR